MKHLRKFSIIAVLMLSACSAAGAGATPTLDGNALATSVFSTAMAAAMATGEAMHTATPTQTLTPTPQPPTPTPTIMPTIEPVIGKVHAPTNIRSGPGKGGNERVGGLLFNQQVKVIGRNVEANWLWIIYTNVPAGTAWVLTAAVDLDGDLTHLPIVVPRKNNVPLVFPPIIYKITGAPQPLNSPAPGLKTATITQLAKVRLGPGVGYSSIAAIDPGSIVVVTGRTDGNGWLQIEYPSGLESRGWISANLAHMNTEFAGLPFYNLMATPVSEAEAKAGINFDSVPNTAPDSNVTTEPTQTLEPTPAGPTGEVYEASEINIRSGPATSYDLLGTLKLGDKVVLTGQTINSLWYQIVYPAGPGGFGWVSTKYIKITGGDMTKLSYFDTQGTSLPKP